MRIIIFLVVFAYIFLLITSSNAGQGTTLPNTIQGITYSVSFGYPDILRQDKNHTISMSMAITFNNASVTNINITEIHVYVVSEDVNIDPYHHDVTRYFLGEQYAYDRASKPLYRIDRRTLGETVVADFSDTRLFEWDYFNEEVTGKIYVEVELRVQTNLTIGVMPYGYTLIHFSGAGEMPRVQLLPRESLSSSDLLYENLGLIVGLILVIIGVVVTAIYFQRKRIKQPSSYLMQCAAHAARLSVV